MVELSSISTLRKQRTGSDPWKIGNNLHGPSTQLQSSKNAAMLFLPLLYHSCSKLMTSVTCRKSVREAESKVEKSQKHDGSSHPCIAQTLNCMPIAYSCSPLQRPPTRPYVMAYTYIARKSSQLNSERTRSIV